MIELRWKSYGALQAPKHAIQTGQTQDGFYEYAVLQYREYLDYSDTETPEMMWNDWQDVEISGEDE